MRSGPFGKVEPDDPPMSFCTEHHRKYNPYKHSKCPECRRDESSNDVPVVDPNSYTTE